jgi:hypothetical protein
MPEWFAEYQQDTQMDDYEGKREGGLIARMFPDFQSRSLGKKLGISPNE